MPVLSIIACRMLEDEIAHLLLTDKKTRQIILVDGRECSGLSGKLRTQNRPHIVVGLDGIPKLLKEMQSKTSIPFPGHLARLGFGGIFFHRNDGRKNEVDLTVVVSLLKIGLHADLEKLKSRVYEHIRQISSFSDGILILYGKCGNSLADLEHDFKDLACPLYFLTDDQGERIEDCIAAALGGNGNYDRTLMEHQDVALFMTPMWASNWKTMEKESAASGGRRDMRAMLKGSRFKKVARIQTGLCFETGVEEKVNGFAQAYGLEKIELKGGTKVVDSSYRGAKSLLLRAP
jgi:hypothetical protein